MVDNRYNPYKGLSDRSVESLMPKGVEHRLDGNIGVPEKSVC